MRTSESMDRLDPMRPSVRRMAEIRFKRQQYGQFLLDLEDVPQWRFSPTALFLAAKAYFYLEHFEDSERACAESLESWGETLDGETPLSTPDQDRLDLSFLVLQAQIAMGFGRLDRAEGFLEQARKRIDSRAGDDFADLLGCLRGECERLGDLRRAEQRPASRGAPQAAATPRAGRTHQPAEVGF